ELKEVAGANAVATKILARGMNLAHASAFVHGIKDSLRARFDSHPHFDAACIGECIDCFASHQVAARLHAEGGAEIALCGGGCELAGPTGREAEDIVGEPELIGREARLYVFDFTREAVGSVASIGVSIDGLRAPVAAVGAASAGDQIEREVAVS